jgi:hypothetical protein
MRRRWKILGAILVLIVAPLAVNTIVTNNETKPAKADGGRIIDLQGATFR